jgi:hypothetical protein
MVSLDAIGGEHGHACTSSNRERRQKIEMAIILDEVIEQAKVKRGGSTWASSNKQTLLKCWIPSRGLIQNLQ